MTNPFNPSYRAEKEAQEQHALGALQDVITAPVDDVHTATATATRRWDRCDSLQPEYSAPPPSSVTAGTWPHVNWSGGGDSSRWAQPPLRSLPTVSAAPLHRSPPPPPSPPAEPPPAQLLQEQRRMMQDLRRVLQEQRGQTDLLRATLRLLQQHVGAFREKDSSSFVPRRESTCGVDQPNTEYAATLNPLATRLIFWRRRYTISTV